MAEQTNSTEPASEKKEEIQQLEFLYKAIEDTRFIIDLLDKKIIAAFVVLVLPIGKLGTIVTVIKALLDEKNSSWQYSYGVPPLVIIFSLSYILAVFFAYRCICARQNPVAYIETDGEEKPDGTFYLHQKKRISSTVKLFPAHMDLVQRIRGYSIEKCISELTFEFMKLVVIRESKQRQQQLCFQFLTAYISSGIIIYLVYLFCVNINP